MVSPYESRQLHIGNVNRGMQAVTSNKITEGKLRRTLSSLLKLLTPRIAKRGDNDGDLGERESRTRPDKPLSLAGDDSDALEVAHLAAAPSATGPGCSAHPAGVLFQGQPRRTTGFAAHNGGAGEADREATVDAGPPGMVCLQDRCLRHGRPLTVFCLEEEELLWEECVEEEHDHHHCCYLQEAVMACKLRYSGSNTKVQTLRWVRFGFGSMG